MEYGLIGERLSHSFSEEIHSFIGKYEYSLCPLSPEEVGGFLKKGDFLGLNVTVPYKRAVIPYLDGISENAKKIGAVNTVINRDGRLYGCNTDFDAMKAALEREKIVIKNKKVLILGTGGTSRTAFAVCTELGAESVTFVSRNGTAGTVSYSEAPVLCSDASVIINTTPVGMYPDSEKSPVDLSLFKKLEAVFDAVYNPLRTSLVIQAEGLSLKACGGLYMLVHQAIRSGEIFLGTALPAELYEKIYRKVLSEKLGIALIGMPSCGKTTLGALLSENTGRTHYDTDSLIEEKCALKISEIFEKYGEEYFRKIESEVIADISEKNGAIISTGGGAVLREENVRRLKHNSVLVFLKRELESLSFTEDRPLSSNAEDLENMYHTRQKIYSSVADCTVNADVLSSAAAKITERYSL